MVLWSGYSRSLAGTAPAHGKITAHYQSGSGMCYVVYCLAAGERRYCYEEVPPTLASVETVTEEDPPLKMASLKDARAVIEKGECANWIVK